eukprot:g4769.t1
MAFFSSIENALEALRRGECIVVLDDDNRENEGDLIIPCEKITPEIVTFMVQNCTGIICCATTEERLEELRLPQMVPKNTENHGCAFTVSVDYKHGTTTGVSSKDRALTIRNLAPGSDASASDFNRPGHVFPLQARRGGVLERAGHTEASVDLSRLAGCSPAGCICEIVNEDGSMARLPELKVFAKKHGLHMITIADLINYRLRTERLVSVIPSSSPSSFSSSSSSPVPSSFGNEKSDWSVATPHGTFQKFLFRFALDGSEHFVLTKGKFAEDNGWNEDKMDNIARKDGTQESAVYVHIENPVQDLFGDRNTQNCTRAKLLKGLADVSKSKCGILIYIRPLPEKVLNGRFPSEISVSQCYATLCYQIIKYFGLSECIDVGGDTPYLSIAKSLFGLTVN